MDNRTVYQGGSAEIVEKKSRFIGEVFPVASQEDVEAILERTRKRYWDARHHCWAYVIGKNPVQERCSDDGEPAGTAGKPMLEVLKGQELSDVLVVVTRYFGGTLLGTGGLVRAYTLASREALAHSTIITRISGFKLRIQTDYTGLGKIQYLLAQKNIPVYETQYTDKAELWVLVPKEEEARLTADIAEATNAQAVTEREAACSFGEVNGKICLL